MGFLLTILLSSNLGSQCANNGPELQLTLDVYKKSSIYMNSSIGTPYKDIYNQLIFNKGSFFHESPNVEKGRSEFMIMNINQVLSILLINIHKK